MGSPDPLIYTWGTLLCKLARDGVPRNQLSHTAFGDHLGTQRHSSLQETLHMVPLHRLKSFIEWLWLAEQPLDSMGALPHPFSRKVAHQPAVPATDTCRWVKLSYEASRAPEPGRPATAESKVSGHLGPTWWPRRGVREPAAITAELGSGTLGSLRRAQGILSAGSHSPLWSSSVNT